MGLSVISPRNQPALHLVFEIGQPSKKLDKETLELVDHAIHPSQLALLQGFQVPGNYMLFCAQTVKIFWYHFVLVRLLSSKI